MAKRRSRFYLGLALAYAIAELILRSMNWAIGNSGFGFPDASMLGCALFFGVLYAAGTPPPPFTRSPALPRVLYVFGVLGVGTTVAAALLVESAFFWLPLLILGGLGSLALLVAGIAGLRRAANG
jgi:hypothetical protein